MPITKYDPEQSKELRVFKKATASWYGPGFYGKQTANEEVLDKAHFTFAHKFMPFGTMVVFKHNGRTAIGRCNDRGPFVEGRDFDLGYALKEALGFSKVGEVEYKVIPMPPPALPKPALPKGSGAI